MSLLVKLADSRYEQIKEVVADTIEDAVIYSYPFDVLEVLQKLEIGAYSYQSLSPQKQEFCFKKSEDAFSILINYGTHSEWRIYYNAEVGDRRIRFTLMHELGHICLDHQQENEVAEAEANFFAKNILVPPCIIQLMDIKDYHEISDKFDVSLEMSRYQMDYYQKWLQYGGSSFTEYEKRILHVFLKYGHKIHIQQRNMRYSVYSPKTIQHTLS
jgi:hypothetical protein